MSNYNSYFAVSELVKPNNPGFKCKENFLVDPNGAITSNIVQQHDNLEKPDNVVFETNGYDVENESNDVIDSDAIDSDVIDSDIDNKPTDSVNSDELNELDKPNRSNNSVIKKSVNNFYRNPTVKLYGLKTPSYVRVVKPQNFTGILILLLAAIFIVLLVKRN